jgi:hypothetical protein
MNILDRFAYPDEWVSVVNCNDCKKQTPTKESFEVQRDCEYFGVNGFMNVRVCKECYREQQLNKLV